MINDLVSSLQGIDYRLLSHAVNLTNQYGWLHDFVYFCAQLLIFVLPVLLIILWELPEAKGSKHGTKKAVMLAVMSALLGTALKSVINVVWARPRPFITHTDLVAMTFKVDAASFPSGHTMLAFALAFSLVFSGYKKSGWCAVILAVLVGLGRIFSGVHYPSDVLAGAVIGVAAAWWLHREASSIKKYLPDR
ncbi:MAG: phosphatase PAP2 family protein [bacterium]